MKLKTPVAVGLPEIMPVAAPKLRPVGRAPADTVHEMGTVPVAVYWWLYAAPTVPVDGGSMLLMTGAVGATKRFKVKLAVISD